MSDPKTDKDVRCARCGWTRGLLSMVTLRSTRPARLLCVTCTEQVLVGIGDDPVVCAVAYQTNAILAALVTTREPVKDSGHLSILDHVKPHAKE